MESNSKKVEKIRHSLAHILACAVDELYEDVKFGIGPAIDNGFYYDFDFKKEKISKEDLPKIEKKMKELIKKNIEFEKKEISRKKAKEIFKNQPYKLKLLKDIKDKGISIYKSENFIDLCKGPHVTSTKEINYQAFTLTKVAGAYFKGNEENEMLTRVYGVAFKNKKQLKEYQKKIEEAKKRDHRKIGQKLKLFTFDKEVGQGLPLYLPRGARVRHLLMDFALNVYLKHGYELVSSPHIGSEELWRHSGHLKFYKEDMYGALEVDEDKYRLKPMNCPFHIKMYKNEIRSYRDLPIRWAEMGTVYRYEKSGELHGLTRPRGFTQDDAHIFCTPNQLQDEILKALEITKYIYSTLGMEDLIFKLSIRDPEKIDKYFGTDKQWNKAETSLKKALKKFNQSDYELDEGGAAFYAPKIDIDAVDAMGRRWQLSTIQIDFNLPSKFNLEYVNEKGEKETPFMIHRALLGSIERFLGVYIEHTKGNFPLWLAPVQVWIIPIADDHEEYAKKISKKLKEKGIRVDIKSTDKTLSKRIRKGEIMKIPYLLIVGDDEIKENTVSVRFENEDKGTK
ncbi:MAG: threonine--tRNA ligase, partial [Minisyncoccales bacterium]